jgi:phosphate transport system substrate-binding protein
MENAKRRSGPPPIVFILIFLALLGGAYWFFFRRDNTAPVATPPGVEAPQAGTTQTTPGAAPANFTLLPSVQAGTTVRIDGSTSMVLINEALKAGFTGQYANTKVNTNATGSTNGINALRSGVVDVAAVSRSLTPEEQAEGMVAIPVANDAIALVVGENNPFQTSLTPDQVMGIFSGTITDWSQVGGPAGTIRAINRPAVSGTAQAFQEMVLGGGTFGTTPNITTLAQDATTPMLRQLGNDGIGYATFDQVATQQTVRVVPINGLTPEAPNYPFQRPLYYVYNDASNPAVEAFLGYALSPQGQQAIRSATMGN